MYTHPNALSSLLLLALLAAPAPASAQEVRPKPKLPGRVEEAPLPPPRRPARLEQPAAPCKPADPDALVRLDLPDAPASELAAEVARLLCKRFTLDAVAVHARVHLVSGAELRARELWPAFLGALAASDLTIVDRGDLVSIIDATEATRAGVPVLGLDEALPSEERFVTKLFRVKEAERAVMLTNLLNIFKSGKGQVHVDPTTGLLLVTDSTSSVRRLAKLLAAFESTPPATQAARGKGGSAP